jgi:hypothetical protein
MGGYSVQCPMCGKWFLSPNALAQHQKYHITKPLDKGVVLVL